MANFVDPRTSPAPTTAKPIARTTSDRDSIDELLRLCEAGRLYEVERWIRAGKPLQHVDGKITRRRRRTSALRVAVKKHNHALVLLLLCNGYDPNFEPECVLDLALETRQLDVVELLLTWGANPQRVDREKLFDTYSTGLFQRFYEVGVDLTEVHAMAEALGFHTSNNPLYGFAKRHHENDPKIQRELNMALVHHAAEGNERGALLCLWAGADPHARVPSLQFWDEDEEEDEDVDIVYPGYWSAVYGACYSGHITLLEKFCPDPALDEFERLYQLATNPAVVELLAPMALPLEMTEVVGHLLRSASGWFREREAIDTLERLFELGARWTEASKKEIREIRRFLLETDDHDFSRIIRILATEDYCSSEIRSELARTPAVQKRLKQLRFLPARRDDPDSHWGRRPTDADEIVAKLGIEVKKPKPVKKPLPRSFRIQAKFPDDRQIRTDREGLLDLVWSKPISHLAEEWGISGTAIAKACRKVKVPVPPRGFWAKVAAGKRMKKPKLPKLPEGQAEEIVVG